MSSPARPFGDSGGMRTNFHSTAIPMVPAEAAAPMTDVDGRFIDEPAIKYAHGGSVALFDAVRHLGRPRLGVSEPGWTDYGKAF